jgi:hypothetical protein
MTLPTLADIGYLVVIIKVAPVREVERELELARAKRKEEGIWFTPYPSGRTLDRP